MKLYRGDIKRIVMNLGKQANEGYSPLEAYNLIFNYCKEHKCSPTRQKIELLNGFVLSINDEIIDSVAYLLHPEWDEESYRMEGRILARAGL